MEKGAHRMGPYAPFVVRIERRPDIPLARAMSDIRIWLDRRKLRPISFKCVDGVALDGAIEIAFSSRQAATEFERDFVPAAETAQP
jgi:hypothetical protein